MALLGVGAMARLTQKQEVYVNELIKGKSQREAYRIAYPSSLKWKDKSVDNRASKLFNTAEVLARYKELSKEVTESLKKDTIASKQEVLEFFTKMMRKELHEETIITDIHKESTFKEDGSRVEVQTRIPKTVKTITKNTDAYKGAEALAKHYELLSGDNPETTERVVIDTGGFKDEED